MDAWRWREGLLLTTAFIFSFGFAGVGILILMIVAAGELIAREPLWMPTSIDRGLVGLIIVAFLSALWSPWRQVALPSAIVLGVTAPIAVRAVVLATARDQKFVGRLLTAWAVGGLAASLIGMALIGKALDARAELPGLGYNALGTVLAVAAVLVLALSLGGPRRRRFLFAAAFPGVALGLVFTWSRGAWLGALLGLGTLLVTTGSRRFWIGMVAALAVLAATAPIIAPRWQWHEARLRDVAVTEGPFSRIAIWRVVPAIVAEHPTVGTGLASFPYAYARHTGQQLLGVPPFAHNIFLNFAVETGLLGLAALLLFLGTGTLAIVRWHMRSPPRSADRTMSAVVLAAFVALMGHQLVDGTATRVDIAFGLYALLALGAAADRRSRDTT